MRRPSARTLILDLLGTIPPGASMPVATLVEAAGLFAVPATNVRVALVRLLEAGQVARDERGRYRLGERGLLLGRRVRDWRHLDRRTRSWRGGWLGVHGGTGTRPAQRQRAAALRPFGFAKLDGALWLRPDNLTAPVDGLRAELQALGAPAGDLVFRLDDLDAITERRAHGLWDVEALRRGYRAGLRSLATSAARLATLADEAAMVESFLVGGAVLRDLVRDPLLPEAICPGDERRALVASLRDYDRAGRAAWAGLLQRHDVPYLRAPLDARPGTKIAHAG
jgi:phenylacetic acid degradation operon negative regulatory protein